MKVPPAWKTSAMQGSREQLGQFRHVPFPPFTVDEGCLGTGCHPTERETNAAFRFPDALVTRSFVHLKKKRDKEKQMSDNSLHVEADLK